MPKTGEYADAGQVVDGFEAAKVRLDGLAVDLSRKMDKGSTSTGLIAHIGDSLSSDDEYMQPSAQQFILSRYLAKGFTSGEWYGVWGKSINTPDGRGKTTVQNIRDIRAKGVEPAVWVIALATNIIATGAQQTAGNYSADEAAMDQVLTELGPSAFVVAVGMCASGSPTNSFHQGINQRWQTRMAARGGKGHFADYMAHLQAKPGMDWNSVGAIFRDGTHLTTQGYTDKYDWLSADVAAAASSLVTSTEGIDNVARADAAQAKADAAEALAIAYNGGVVVVNQAMTPVAKSRLMITERIA